MTVSVGDIRRSAIGVHCGVEMWVTCANNIRPLKVASRCEVRVKSNCCLTVWWICKATTVSHNVRVCVACVCYCAHCHVVCRRHFLHAPPLSATMLMALYLLITATAELTHTTALSRASIQRSMMNASHQRNCVSKGFESPHLRDLQLWDRTQ